MTKVAWQQEQSRKTGKDFGFSRFYDQKGGQRVNQVVYEREPGISEMERHKERLCTLYFLCCGEDRTQRKTKVNGQFQTLNIPIPPMLKNYIAGMGGVDLSDQLLQCYQALPRTRKWWKHFFFILWIFLHQMHILYIRKLPKV